LLPANPAVVQRARSNAAGQRWPSGRDDKQDSQAITNGWLALTARERDGATGREEKAKADDRRKGILYHEPRMARRPSMSMSMRGAVCLLVTMRRVD